MARPGRILRRAPHPMVGLARTRARPSRHMGLGRGRLRGHLGLGPSLGSWPATIWGRRGPCRSGSRLALRRSGILSPRQNASRPDFHVPRGKAVSVPGLIRTCSTARHPSHSRGHHEPQRSLCDRLFRAVPRCHWRHRCGGNRHAPRVAARAADAEPIAPAESGTYASGADPHPAGSQPDASTAGARSDSSDPGAHSHSPAASLAAAGLLRRAARRTDEGGR